MFFKGYHSRDIIEVDASILTVVMVGRLSRDRFTIGEVFSTVFHHVRSFESSVFITIWRFPAFTRLTDRRFLADPHTCHFLKSDWLKHFQVSNVKHSTLITLIMMQNLASLRGKTCRKLIPRSIRKWQTNPWNSAENEKLKLYLLAGMYIDYWCYWLAWILTRALVETNQR